MENVGQKDYPAKKGIQAMDSGLSLGPLSWVYDHPEITDIAVTCDGAVWCDTGSRMVLGRQIPAFRNKARLREYAMSLCAQLGIRLDDAHPIADAASAQGVRIHAVIAPIVPFGAAITIRLPNTSITSLNALVNNGMIPEAWQSALERCVASKANILITGATGAGKTTLLKALLSECKQNERIISVEEVREIFLTNHPHHIALVSREANVEGSGYVGLDQLVKATLRMRPDRVVLGECRGEEIADMLRVFSSGHRGGMVTLHADSVQRVPQRLISLGLLAGLDSAAVAMLVEGAFDVVLHVQRSQGIRRLDHIGVLEVHNGVLRARTLARWQDVEPSRFEKQTKQTVLNNHTASKTQSAGVTSS